MGQDKDVVATSIKTHVTKIAITRHAVERLLERKPRKYKKISGEVVANIITNVIRSGRYLEREEETPHIRFSTRKYTVCCTKKDDTLVVTTVMNTEEMSEEYKRALRFSKESPFKENTLIVTNPLRQIDNWIKRWGREEKDGE
ncbi:MAG: hypothetical protein ACXQTS_06420 [Candidatus Methanospirareceae archaeon]